MLEISIFLGGAACGVALLGSIILARYTKQIEKEIDEMKYDYDL
jgi:hypothetical protein